MGLLLYIKLGLHFISITQQYSERNMADFKKIKRKKQK